MQSVDQAREAVLSQLAMAYESHATREQVLVAEGRYDQAAEYHEFALLLLRAYKDEADDPTPTDGAHCAECLFYERRR
jgi:hypothetical protein